MATNHELLAAMLDVVSEGVCHTDLDRRIVFWNAAAGRITGFHAPDVDGCRCQDRVLCHVDRRGKVLCSSQDCPLLVPMHTGKPYEAELFLHHREGHLVFVSVRTEPYFDAAGELAGITQVFRELKPVGRRSDDKKKWRQAALTDPLTGLGNRRAFRSSWARAHRSFSSRGVPIGILMIDVDYFKSVNDDYGHAIGDRVLRMVARTLAGSLRVHDSVIRWGGEEFLVLVPEATLETLADLGERIRQLVERGWVVLAGGKHLGVTVSVGGALVRPEDRVTDVVARADRRLFECKAAGRNRSLTGG